MLKHYQKLKEPHLVELQGELGFVIVTEIDTFGVSYGVLRMKGQSYNYEDGEMEKGPVKEIHFSVKEEAYYDLDANGEIID